MHPLCVQTKLYTFIRVHGNLEFEECWKIYYHAYFQTVEVEVNLAFNIMQFAPLVHGTFQSGVTENRFYSRINFIQPKSVGGLGTCLVVASCCASL